MKSINRSLALICLAISSFLCACDSKKPEARPIAESLPAETEEQPVVQIPGQPYVDDPGLSERANKCERGWHELPAKAEAVEHLR